MTATDLDLLLAHADQGSPVLTTPMSETDLDRAQRPADGVKAGGELGDPVADPNDLAAQGWGVVVPEGGVGQQMLAALAPLIARRAEQWGREIPVHRCPPGLDGRAALDWVLDVFAPPFLPESDIPAYVLLAGDLHELSVALQQTLSVQRFVGRVTGTPAGVAAYAAKVLRWEQAPVELAPELLLHTVHDGTQATTRTHQALMDPGALRLRSKGHRARLIGDPLVPDPDDLWDEVGTLRAGRLMSVGHGAGAPRNGWSSPAAQRADQGSLVFGPGMLLRGADLAQRPFLPGGIWLNLSCFGAGTPAESAFHHWLTGLAADGHAGAGQVLAGMPSDGGGGFVSHLGRQVLAAPEGPLAMLGHIDLAWTHGFEDVAGAGGVRVGRFTDVLEALGRGARLGPAARILTAAFMDADRVLTATYDRIQRARVKGKVVQIDQRALARTWMQRQDLQGYILLGDPAVRCGGGREPAPAVPQGPGSTAPRALPTDPTQLQDLPPAVAQALAARIAAGAPVRITEHFDPPGSDQVARREIHIGDTPGDSGA